MDPRLTPARPDLAAAHLKGQVEAERFVEPVMWQCAIAAAPIRRTPASDGAMDDQLLAGEHFAALEQVEGWAWGYAANSGYVGWVDLSGLSSDTQQADRRISVLRTYGFSQPDMKSAPVILLSLNACFTAGERKAGFVHAGGLGWIHDAHAAPIDHRASDFVAVAEAFLGSPYLWGGKESLGLDCSGLLQMALGAAGIAAPRDADQQEAFLRDNWQDVTSDPARQRGDVVFWPGHVGIMTDSEHLLHANAHTMDTTLEDFRGAEARIAAKENPVRSIFRPD
jgi:cell wall-associated NlpC family hydrolase